MQLFLLPKSVRFSVVLCLALCSVNAIASAPWDGSWFRDVQRSHWPDIIQLALAADGTWTFFNGVEEKRFVADGKVHRIGSSAIELCASQPDPQTLVIVEGIHGRAYDTDSLSISAGVRKSKRDLEESEIS